MRTSANDCRLGARINNHGAPNGGGTSDRNVDSAADTHTATDGDPFSHTRSDSDVASHDASREPDGDATSSAGGLPTVAPTPTATPPPLQAALPTATATPLPIEATSTQVVVGGCTLVELYPGYPGYRGYVAGVDGPGEVACLQDLMTDDPTFNKEAEDAANLAAAQAVVQPGRRFIGLATTAIQATARSHANVLFLPHSC